MSGGRFRRFFLRQDPVVSRVFLYTLALGVGVSLSAPYLGGGPEPQLFIPWTPTNSPM